MPTTTPHPIGISREDIIHSLNPSRYSVFDSVMVLTLKRHVDQTLHQILGFLLSPPLKTSSQTLQTRLGPHKDS